MLHAAVLIELLDDEVAVARLRLDERIVAIDRTGSDVVCRFNTSNGGEYRLRLDGRAYDAEPFRIAAVDEDGNVLPAGSWPPGLCGGDHPVLLVPFACVQGTWEYHTHPQRVGDVWDRTATRGDYPICSAIF